MFLTDRYLLFASIIEFIILTFFPVSFLSFRFVVLVDFSLHIIKMHQSKLKNSQRYSHQIAFGTCLKYKNKNQMRVSRLNAVKLE